MNRSGIYAIGAALVDTELQVDDKDLQFLEITKGVMTLVNEDRHHQLFTHFKDKLAGSERACGGSAANTLVAAHYFGSRTFFSCQVADDPFGKFYAENLLAAGISTQALEDAVPGVTGKCLVMVTPDAERTMNTFLGISEQLSVTNVRPSAIQNRNYVYIEGYLVTSVTGKLAAMRVREYANEFGVKVAISLSDPALVTHFRRGLTEIMGAQVDIIFCNESEAMAFTEQDSLERAALALKKYCKTFAITRGSKPTWIFDGKENHLIDTHPVKAVDTNGAGDMFAGAFLSELDQGKPYIEAGAFANRAAAVVVSQFGPRLTAEQYRQLKDQA
jgi:sugar/nucleoside kinase (ribokinase family)